MEAFSLNIHGTLRRYERPAVMGIINVTPDSFYAGSRTFADAEIAARVEEMMAAGADILDIGAYSSRPGANDICADDESERLRRGLAVIRQVAGPEIAVSVDTFRAGIARRCIEEWGADIINDISGGLLDPEMPETVGALHVPYILMHMRGTPADMQTRTDYTDVTADVLAELGERLSQFAMAGAADIIIDPGFGFSKTLEQNYRLLRDLRLFGLFHRPILVGISRKSMITRLLGITPDEALNGTTALNVMALERGASILRVHDVRAAREAVDIFMATEGDMPTINS